MTGIPPSVRVVKALIHVSYVVDGRAYDTRVGGVSTDIVASRFVAGDSIEEIAREYDWHPLQVTDALRWELRPRRTRVRMVEKAARR